MIRFFENRSGPHHTIGAVIQVDKADSQKCREEKCCFRIVFTYITVRVAIPHTVLQNWHIFIVGDKLQQWKRWRDWRIGFTHCWRGSRYWYETWRIGWWRSSIPSFTERWTCCGVVGGRVVRGTPGRRPSPAPCWGPRWIGRRIKSWRPSWIGCRIQSWRPCCRNYAEIRFACQTCGALASWNGVIFVSLETYQASFALNVVNEN